MIDGGRAGCVPITRMQDSVIFSQRCSFETTDSTKPERGKRVSETGQEGFPKLAETLLLDCVCVCVLLCQIAESQQVLQYDSLIYSYVDIPL